ncbi:MAG: hypothetical protein NXI32_22960 [bacterium]|nr:hypothetical protein [bacterium]
MKRLKTTYGKNVVLRQSRLFAINALVNSIKTVVGIVVGLFVTRFWIQAAGLEGLGILVVIGASGFLFSMVTATLSQALQREFAYHIGHDSPKILERIFATAFYLQLIASIIVFAGLWIAVPLLLKEIDIPPSWSTDVRRAAYLNIVMLSSGVFLSPFNAVLAANQEFRLLSVIDIVASLARLSVAACLTLFPGNLFAIFAATNLLTSVILGIICAITCIHRYEYICFSAKCFSLKTLSKFFSYGAALLLGKLSYQLRTNGISIFFSICFGNLAAAGNGIAIRAAGLLQNSVVSLIGVAQPALTRAKGQGNDAICRRLANLVSALSFLLATLLAFPLILFTEPILLLWLGDYPASAPSFVRWTAATVSAVQISIGQNMTMHAIGKVFGLMLSNVAILLVSTVIGIVLAYQFADPKFVFQADFFGTLVVSFAVQPWLVANCQAVKIADWVRETIIPCFTFLILCFMTGIICCSAFEPTLLTAFVSSTVCLIFCIGITWCLVFTKEEKERLFKSENFRLTKMVSRI